MTTVSVNVPGFIMNNMPQTPRVQEAEPGEKFGDVLKTQTQAETNSKPVENGETTPKQEEVAEASEVADNVENDTNTGEVKSEKEVSKVTDEDATESVSRESFEEMIVLLQQVVGDVKELLMREFNLSEEELKNLMQEFGMTEIDLLNPDQFKELVLSLNGVEDAFALLTNETAYQSTKEVMKEFENLLSEAGVDMETIQELPKEYLDEYATSMKEQTISVKSDEPVIVTMDTRSEETIKITSETSRPNANNDGEKQMAGQNQPNTFVQNLLNNQTVNNLNNLNPVENFQMVTTPEDVMSQIMDYMEVHLSNEDSVIDMQLTPENLGTLQVKISAKEGVMTAQFVTTSDTVKTILETQMIQLQDNFDKQGIKVEAIEVTVETHQFEQNLHGEGERQQSQEGSKPRTRRIDLSRLEEVEDITPEEELIAQMMVANGSTVDYLV